MKAQFVFRLSAWIIVLVTAMCIAEPKAEQISAIAGQLLGYGRAAVQNPSRDDNTSSDKNNKNQADDMWANVLPDASTTKSNGSTSTSAEEETKPTPTPRPVDYRVTEESCLLELSSYNLWESGEFSTNTGLPVVSRRRLRYPEYLPADYEQYTINISEDYNLNIIEYNSEMELLLVGTYKNGDLYEPSRKAAYFSISLFRTYDEKKLSPGQWNGIFEGIVVELSGNHLR